MQQLCLHVVYVCFGSKFIAKVFETADISKQVCHSMSPLRLQDKGYI